MVRPLEARSSFTSLVASRFAPRVLLGKPFRPLGLCLVQDPVRVQSGSLEKHADPLDSVRLRPGVLVRQLFRLFRKIFLRRFLKNFRKNSRKSFRKVFSVRLVIEPLVQDLLQLVMHARLQQAEFQTTPPHDIPFQRYHISHKQLIDDINGLYRRAHPAN